MTTQFRFERIEFDVKIQSLGDERGDTDAVLLANRFQRLVLSWSEFNLCAGRSGFLLWGFVVVDDLLLDVFSEYDFALLHGAASTIVIHLLTCGLLHDTKLRYLFFIKQIVMQFCEQSDRCLTLSVAGQCHAHGLIVATDGIGQFSP